MATIRLTIEYDGSRYAGWQRQRDRPTVQAAIEAALQQITQTDISVVGAGRTDAGVHALGQVASFRTDITFSSREWIKALNAVLPPDISIKAAQEVADNFHARYSARAKLYRYRILNRPERSALELRRAWHIRGRLNLIAMREAVAALVGRHDFSSFQGSLTDAKDPICHLSMLEITQVQAIVRIELQADRFLKQMARAIVGTLVEVGLAKRSPETIKAILAAGDRRTAGKTAPAHGLYLVRVEY